MSRIFDSFDDSNGSNNSNIQPIEPLFTVTPNEEGKVSEWVKNAFKSLMKRNADYFEEIKENLKLYKGALNVNGLEKTSANQRTTSEADGYSVKARNAKLYVNKIYDLVEWRVTTHNAAKPGIDIGPANVEYEDRIAADVAKAVIDSIWYTEDQDEIERNALKHNFLAGEHYVAICWNPDKGPIHPDYKKDIKIKDRDGKVRDYKGAPVRIGDVEYKHYPAWRVLPEPVETYDKVEWHICWDIECIEKLKVRFPKKRDLIKKMSSESIEGFDEDYLKKLYDEDKTVLLTIYHKRTKYLPNGRLIVATVDGTILEDRDLPYQHELHPLIRLTDIDVPGELRGKSFLRNIKGLQYQHTFLTSMFAANAKLIGYPKFQMEQNSLNIKDLANARTIIQRRPGSAPVTVLQPQAIPSDMFQYMKELEINMDASVKGAFANPSSLPARIDSGIALQYLNEQDAQRQHTMFAKVNMFRVNLVKLTLAVVGEYYDVNDKRLLHIVGQNHEHDIKYFDFANFNRPYDIRVKSGSALPEGRAARIDTILQLTKELPEGTFTTQQILDMLDLGSTEKLFDLGTKATRASESIIQDLLSNKPVPPPEGYEDLMAYWNTFSNYIQDRQFKDSIPPEAKQNVLDYLNAIEMLMFDKSMTSPTFAQVLTTLPLYPLVFILPPPPPSAEVPVEGVTQLGKEVEQAEPSEEEMALVEAENAAMDQEELLAAHDLMKNSVTDDDVI